MDYYVGIDMGGTNGRLQIRTAANQILGEFRGKGCSINTDGIAKSRMRFQELVMQAMQSLGLEPEACSGICVAASGIDSLQEEQACRSWLEEIGFAGEKLLVLNDCEVFLYLSRDPALVLLSGTGSICCGRDRNGTKYRTGGWNHILSDEGSGFYFGLRYLQATAEVLDGRKKDTYLTSRIIQKSGLDTLEKINQFVNAHLFEKSEIAKFSNIGYEAACQGDETAIAIHKECAEKLVQLAGDTWNKMGDSKPDQADIWLWGSVLLENNLLQKQVRTMLEQQLPWLKVRIPEKNALETASWVAMAFGMAV